MEYMADPDYILTIIVPLFNEEGNLHRLAKELADYLSLTSFRAKVLFVNDGSTDKSAQMIEKLCAENPDFGYIHLKKNSGLSTALKAGFDQVETRFTGYIDADLQTSPFDFDLLMEYVVEYELVSGIRTGRKDGIIKLLSSHIANAVRRFFTHDGISDTGCPLKIIHTSTAREILFFKGMHRFLPALVQMAGGQVKVVPIRHFARISGKSKYHLCNRLLGPAADLLAFTWMRKRYINYVISGRG
jgi:dolichol-phosphate mannosyltransferase